MRTHRTALSIVSAVCLTALTAVAAAQPIGPGPGRGPGGGPGGFGPGSMMGPGMMGRGGFGPMCGAGMAGFAEWRIDRLRSLLNLTDAQKASFEAYRTASVKAAEAMRAACPADFHGTMPGRMEAMEKRMEAMLAAIKTLRPALDAFYTTLTDEQKVKLNDNRGRGRYWRWRERWNG
ncbi:MAG: Spy/CpxP family protein refolding chaperone [Pseudolabrys sp.]